MLAASPRAICQVGKKDTSDSVQQKYPIFPLKKNIPVGGQRYAVGIRATSNPATTNSSRATYTTRCPSERRNVAGEREPSIRTVSIYLWFLTFQFN